MSKQTELAQVADTITVNSGNVGIGTSSPVYPLVVQATNPRLQLLASGTNTGTSGILFGDADTATRGQINYTHTDNELSFVVNAAEAMHITSSGSVGIGTSSPTGTLDLRTSSETTVKIIDTSASAAGPVLMLGTEDTARDAGNKIGSIRFYSGDSSSPGAGTRCEIKAIAEDAFNRNALVFSTGTFGSAATERMRIDSSGNLLVGTTDALPATNNDANGIALRSDGNAQFSRSGAATARFNRGASDGEIVSFNKDGTTVGSISSHGGTDLGIGSGDTGLRWQPSADAIFPYNTVSSTGRDNAIDLGKSDNRFDDVYATNGTIQTSDRNEKQDIAELDAAEQRVAIACKGLLRKFRWKDAVAEKGDAARIHFGIIAQDLQDAFAAEGLDAGDYAMFISTTWWETQTDVPAVEAVDAVYEDVVIPAVLDEEGNEVEPERVEQQLVTEAVEAKEAYTRTDTYDTQEEAPEGATERTRLGVRYSELLAFIIGAL